MKFPPATALSKAARRFNAHPVFWRRAQFGSVGASFRTSIEEGVHAPSHAAAEELRKCRATAARSPDRVVKLGPSCAEQLVGQRLLVPTHVFGDVPSNLVYEGIVTQRTRGRADCVVSRRRC